VYLFFEYPVEAVNVFLVSVSGLLEMRAFDNKNVIIIM